VALLSKLQSFVDKGCEKGDVCRDLGLHPSQVQQWEKNGEALEKPNPQSFPLCQVQNSFLDPFEDFSITMRSFEGQFDYIEILLTVRVKRKLKKCFLQSTRHNTKF
jgi:hypothetical protein